MLGCHLVKSWSKGQAIVALSSAESELYACVKATSEGMGVLSVFKDFGMTINGKIWADASAALGIISRRGLGKVRHLDTSRLWIQEVNARKDFEFSKVAGSKNIADLMTKYLSRETAEMHFNSMGLSKDCERPEAASQTIK